MVFWFYCVRRRRTHPKSRNTLAFMDYTTLSFGPPRKFFRGEYVISMPCASVLLFGVICRDKIVLCYGLLLLQEGFHPR